MQIVNIMCEFFFLDSTFITCLIGQIHLSSVAVQKGLGLHLSSHVVLDILHCAQSRSRKETMHNNYCYVMKCQKTVKIHFHCACILIIP